MDPRSRRVAIFARWPQPGDVKTRLSPSVPAAQACEIHRAMLLDTLSLVSGSGATECLVYWLGAPGDAVWEGLPLHVKARAQRGQDLGQRLRHGFDEMLAGPGDRAIAIGSDCPELTGSIVRRAFEALEETDVVLGPACDGGYFLIGLRRPAPALFEGIGWGTDGVLEETRRKARGAGLTTTMLETLSDLDTPENLIHFAARAIGGTGPAAPHTIAALRAMGLLPAFG